MNTTNALPAKNKVRPVNRNHYATIIMIALAMVAVTVIAISLTNQTVVSAETKPAVAYSNALEMQYAQPFIDAQSKPVVAFGNALEMQYAQPFIDANSKPAVEFSNALEMQYAQSWIQDTGLSIAVTGVDCHSSLEMLYACQNGYDHP